MSASVVEQILARAALCLTSAGLVVERGRVDAFGESELPAINLRRSGTNEDVIGANGGRLLVAFEIECHVAVTSGWETAADALHVQAHAALMSDAPLAALVRGLRCAGTDVDGDRADREGGLLTARYQMQVFVRPGDLTRVIS